MKQLITPDKSRHKYVIGIDFGHGETSAAICELEWDKEAGHRESDVKDIDMDISARKKVIPSAICITEEGTCIGDQAFSHVSDNKGIRLSFKKAPVSISGADEQLMIRFMDAVYRNIRTAYACELTDSNHIVYIARPSGWNDEATKETYRQMALEAGIPLAGLTSESRAAIFYSRSPNVKFLNNITKGALVFDLGSSTLDLTYLSDEDNKPVDQGYDDGASRIEHAIFDKYIFPQTKDFLEEYPEFKDALIFEARKFKEAVYSRSTEGRTYGEFKLRRILPSEGEAFKKYGSRDIDLCINNIRELNDLIEQQQNYITDIRKHLIEYRDKEIPGRKVYGVLLTGGASRMAFLRPIIAEVFQLQDSDVRCDNDNPSLTISRGIALLGSTDANTSVLVSKLKESIQPLVDGAKLFDNLVGDLAHVIAQRIWEQVENACNRWVKHGSTTDYDELKKWVKWDLDYFKNNYLAIVVNSTLTNFVKEQSEQVRKEMNQIISRYAPGQEITRSGAVNLADNEAIAKTLSGLDNVILNIGEDFNNILIDIVSIVAGIIFLPIISFIELFRSDESKRTDIANKFLEKKFEAINKIRTSIREELSKNPSFKKQISAAIKSYFDTLIDANLNRVKIPIE